MSAFQSGHIGYNLGQKIHSIESKNKISQANRGSNNSKSILTEDDVKYIKIYLHNGGKQIDMVRKFSISKSVISNIYHERIWKHIKI